MIRRRNLIIGWDGKGPDTHTRRLALFDALLAAKGDLADARRDRRDEEQFGEVSVEAVDRIVACERIVAEIQAEIDSLEPRKAVHVPAKRGGL